MRQSPSLLSLLALRQGDVVVLAQKIASQAEGRIVALADVTPNSRDLELAQVTRKDPRLVDAHPRGPDRAGKPLPQHRPNARLMGACRPLSP